MLFFVDGEFWHGRDWEEKKSKLKKNREYWIEKIEENMARDKRTDAALIEYGDGFLFIFGKKKY